MYVQKKLFREKLTLKKLIVKVLKKLIAKTNLKETN